MNKIKQNTHLLASEKLIGSVVSIEKNKATVSLRITKEMSVDKFSLAHGSFTFGLADYAAMVAINEPTVVLGKAEVKFTKPVIVNDKLTAIAQISEGVKGSKIPVSVKVNNAKNELVFEGVFTCFVLEKHILEK
ncbi:MaoC/PaaZ C-terminal domain-containing protein [Lutibacter citreus]|uniref:MaoC/PaaZ C-terminal domain-containing protein n=1 Tax=Lutibacter citreus TaxID=2138210 RepID=UPI001C553CF7|nr:MaoC/PaaZ C-terminal domain-containing protein [Lutibacter citreus]